MDKMECCRLECNKDAEWVIKYGDTVDDYCHSCNEHLVSMLDSEKVNTVFTIYDS